MIGLVLKNHREETVHILIKFFTLDVLIADADLARSLTLPYAIFERQTSLAGLYARPGKMIDYRIDQRANPTLVAKHDDPPRETHLGRGPTTALEGHHRL